MADAHLCWHDIGLWWLVSICLAIVHFLIMYMVVVYNFHSVLTFGGSHCGMQAKTDYIIILTVYRLEYGNIYCIVRYACMGMGALTSVAECQLEHLTMLADGKPKKLSCSTITHSNGHCSKVPAMFQGSAIQAETQGNFNLRSSYKDKCTTPDSIQMSESHP